MPVLNRIARRLSIGISVLCLAGSVIAEDSPPDDSASAGSGTAVSIGMFVGGNFPLETLGSKLRNGSVGRLELGARSGRWSCDLGVQIGGHGLDDGFLKESGFQPEEIDLSGSMWYLQVGYRLRVREGLYLWPMVGVAYSSIHESSFDAGAEFNTFQALEGDSFPIPIVALRVGYFIPSETYDCCPSVIRECLFAELRVTWVDYGPSPLGAGPEIQLALGFSRVWVVR